MDKQIELTEDQQNASTEFTDFLLDDDAKYMVIQGAAGTGKSTLVKTLLDSVASRMKMYALLIGKTKKDRFSIELTATTNKAANVLAELSDRFAQTIHSKLGLVPHKDYRTGEITFAPPRGKMMELIEHSLVVIDEGSMLSDMLFEQVDNGTRDCKVLIIGDQYQLAPVNQPVPIMDSLECHKATLSKIMRHGGVIAKEGAKYRETIDSGKFSNIAVNGDEIIHVDGPTFQKMVDDEFASSDYTPDKARILAWTNSTVQRYNTHLRSIQGLPEHLCENDILITNKPIVHPKHGTIHTTDEEVMISEVGVQLAMKGGITGRFVNLGSRTQYFLPDDQLQVSALLKSLAKAKKWGEFFDIKDNWLDLRPVFASTVHKAQGSTYDTVYINLADIGKCFVPTDVARMMYVAITRAAKRVVLYGQLPYRYRGN